MHYPGCETSVPWVYEGGYTTSSDISITTTTAWSNDTTTTVYPPLSVSTDTIIMPPEEYKFEEGELKYKDPATSEWEKLTELELKSDPFKPEPVVKETIKAKIKLDKKLGVDAREFEDVLF